MWSKPVVRMATYKTRLQSEKEIQCMLDEIGSEGDDDVSSESDKSSESKSEWQWNWRRPSRKIRIEWQWHNDYTTAKNYKGTGLEVELHFTGNPGIKPAIIRNLPPEPNPLEVFQLMVHDSLWDETATETNRFAVQFYDKNPNSPTISQWFPTTSHEIRAYCALCVLMSQVKKPNLRSYWSIRKSLHTPFFRVYHTTNTYK